MNNKKINIDSIKKQQVHQVPEGYFDELPLKIQSRINEESQPSATLVMTRMHLAWSLTAAFAIFIIGWIVYPISDDSLSVEQQLANINSEALIEYLFEEDISTEDLLANLDEEYLLDQVDGLGSEWIDKDLSDEEMESIYNEMDYLIEI